MKHTKGKIKLQHPYTPNILIGKQYNSGTDAEFSTYVSHPVQKMNKAMANAKRLVMCWNTHDELVEALSELRIAVGNISEWDRFLDEPYKKAVEAIKKATQ